MSQIGQDEESFYLYAMQLFSKAGHVATSTPVFTNHSPEQVVYFDYRSDISLTREQRSMLRDFNSVSCLFSVNECIFMSVNLLVGHNKRSQAAHDIHTLLHPIIGAKGTICLFHWDDVVLLSFMGYGKRCILSNWYPMDDDYETLLTKLDIGNMSVENGYDYFLDMIYVLARRYYLIGQPSTYELIPIDCISNAGTDGVDREEINRAIEYELRAPEREYGDDYVEYDDSPVFRNNNIGKELDLMLLDLEDEPNTSFGEDAEEDDIDGDELFDAEQEDVDHDKYEFDNVDPEVFRDPTLLVKWLNKKDEK